MHLACIWGCQDCNKHVWAAQGCAELQPPYLAGPAHPVTMASVAGLSSWLKVMCLLPCGPAILNHGREGVGLCAGGGPDGSDFALGLCAKVCRLVWGSSGWALSHSCLQLWLDDD
jgi:hypothetical protein